MFLNRTKHRILEALIVEPLHQYAIAELIGEAPYLVRAELKGLKRERLVRDEIKPAGLLWQLTERGTRVALEGRQMELPL